MNDDPWAELPIPKDATDQDRIENAILHLGRIIGMIHRLKEIGTGERRRTNEEYDALAQECRDLLAGIESATKRTATWLGVTIWADEYPAANEG